MQQRAEVLYMAQNKPDFYRIGYPGIVSMTRALLINFRVWESFERADHQYLDAYIDWIGHSETEPDGHGCRWLISCIRAHTIRESDVQRITQHISTRIRKSDKLLIVITCPVRDKLQSLFLHLVSMCGINASVIIDSNVLCDYYSKSEYIKHMYPYVEPTLLHDKSFLSTLRDPAEFIFPFAEDIGQLLTSKKVEIICTKNKVCEALRVEHNGSITIIYDKYYAFADVATGEWDALFTHNHSEIEFDNFKSISPRSRTASYGIVELHVTIKPTLIGDETSKPALGLSLNRPTLLLPPEYELWDAEEGRDFNFIFYPFHRKKAAKEMYLVDRKEILALESNTLNQEFSVDQHKITLSF
ncbi:MAG: hypothetical protein KF784_02300 [Fimbriimonadaceae bacterium]|nr:hypothetical protein [Fimbriimonadaceae bacterium]